MRNPRILLLLIFFCVSVTTGHAGSADGKGSPRPLSFFPSVSHNGREAATFNVSWKGRGGSSEEVAREFLAGEENLSDLPPETRNFSVLSSRIAPEGVHVRLAQTFRGIPVFGAEVVVSMNRDRVVTAVASTASNRLPIVDVIPAITEEDALRLAEDFLNIRGEIIGKETPVLMIYGTDEAGDHLVYRVNTVCSDPMGDWEILVDAHSGEILRTEDRFVQQHFSGGQGFIYRPDPVTTGGASYGSGGYTDSDDMDSDALTKERVLVSLDSLLYEDGTYRLQGPSCTITDIEGPHIDENWKSPAPEFSFTRSEPGFEAVNALYHASTAYEYLGSLGFVIPSLATIRIDPHGYDGEDNSHYSPSGNWIAFGEGGIDDAEDAEVIWHEYGHAIQFNITPSWGGGETRALGEGFGDYWAASYTRSLGLWPAESPQRDWLFHWDGHNQFWAGRILNDPATYPFDGKSIYEAGQIWSAALVGILDDLGREITDRLVLKSQYYLGYGTTARDAALAILQADRDLYSGSHLSILVYRLGTLKHFFDPAEALPVITHVPLGDTPDPDGPYHVVAAIEAGIGSGLQDVFVCWQRSGIEQDTVQMSVIPATGEFEAWIPGDGTGGEIQYCIIAVSTDGTMSALPYNAPQGFFSFRTGKPGIAAGRDTPGEFSLNQNYPNPFNPSTNVTFSIPTDASVILKVFDITGREVLTLLDGILPAGTHRITWNGTTSAGRPAAAGVYFCSLVAASVDAGVFRQTRKMILSR